MEDIFGAGADEEVVGEFHPTHFSRWIEDEFSGARNVSATLAGVGMDEVPTADERVLVVAKE